MTIIVTGHLNVLYQLVIPGGLTDAQLEGLKAGSLDPDDFAAVVPLPTLRLVIRAQGSNPPRWRLNLHHARPTDKSKPLTVPVLTADAEFRSALDTFHALATVALPDAAEAGRLNGAALILGERLAAMLPVEERARLVELGRADGPPPFVVIESTDETVLGLPWELLRLENTWPVKDGRLDVARCYINEMGAVLQPPTGPLHMLLHVCAPANSGLNYEEESYRILRAVRESVAVTVNELGELGDLVGELVQPNPPGVVHFSGHGAQGSLLFENETGGEAFVPAKQFLDELAKAGRVRLPRLFYLGCCHGQTPHANALASEPQVTSTAALLHREGFAQVIAHYGPVYDTQASSAEEAFYQKLAQGGRTRTALRAARHVLAQPFHVFGNEGRRDVEAGLLPAGSVPFAWALLVLYHRGPDHPLAPTNEGPVSIRPATPARHERDAFSGAKSRVLEHGFIGRRKELHEFRRRYEDPVDPHYVHVVHGLGGLGKSVFCQIARRLWDRDGRATINLWCYDVERHPLPVIGLLDQLLQQVDAWQLPGWEREVRMAQTQTADSPGLILRLLAWLVQDWPRPGPRDAPSHVVVHLDNLESLTCPPGTPPEQAEDDDPAAIAPWRDGQCQRFWKGLTQLASNSGGRLLVLASTRYTNDDIRPADRFPFGPMPRDAMLRMMDWLPSLRRLSPHARDRLLPELAGHPFVAVHLATLVQAELERYEADLGPPAPVTNEVAATEEWREFIEPLLVRCHGRLREHLLFDAVWRDVLREPERRLLVRLTILRRPGDHGTLCALGNDLPTSESIRRLRRMGLLTESRESGRPHFEVDPHVVRLAESLVPTWSEWRAEGNARAANWFTQRAAAAEQDPTVTHDDFWDAGQYLLAAGNAKDAFSYLWHFAAASIDHGRAMMAKDVLGDFVDSQANLLLSDGSAWSWYLLMGRATKMMGDVDSALDYFRKSEEIAHRLAEQDENNPEWMDYSCLSHEAIGDVQLAQGDVDAALSSFGKYLDSCIQLTLKDATNPASHMKLSAAHSRIGDVQFRHGRMPEAAVSFGESRGILEKLVPSEESVGRHGQSLVCINQRIADVQLSQGDPAASIKSLHKNWDILRKLDDLEQGHPEIGDLISHNHLKIGDAQFKNEDLVGAIESYRNSKKAMELLVQADKSNSDWQRSLGVCYQRIGEVLSEDGKHKEALDNYALALDTSEFLAQQDLSNAEWQFDVVAILYRFAKLYCRQREDVSREAIAITERLGRDVLALKRWQELNTLAWQLHHAEENMLRKALGIAERLKVAGLVANYAQDETINRCRRILAALSATGIEQSL